LNIGKRDAWQDDKVAGCKLQVAGYNLGLGAWSLQPVIYNLRHGKGANCSRIVMVWI
jgi:hypothetical protein